MMVRGRMTDAAVPGGWEGKEKLGDGGVWYSPVVPEPRIYVTHAITIADMTALTHIHIFIHSLRSGCSEVCRCACVIVNDLCLTVDCC
jgi:hypothetical protein